jgi:hypothetical protein
MRREDLRRLERLEQASGTGSDPVTSIWLIPVALVDGERVEREPVLLWERP